MYKSNNTKIIILGAGLSGLSVAYHLKLDYEIFERNSCVGGLCRSVKIDGFIFDYGPHILFTANQYVAGLIKGLLRDNLSIKQREAWIYHKKYDCYTRFPFQSHLYGLPVELVKKCILGVIDAKYNTEKSSAPKNYQEWMYFTFGEEISEYLMIPYAKKIWTVSPDRMNYDWVKGRIPLPTLEDILEGALHDTAMRSGLNKVFWYPIEGGIEALPRAFLPYVKQVNLNMEATKIFAQKHEIEFNHKEVIGYDILVATIPLPELIKLIENVPEEVKYAADALQYNSIICVNLGIDRPNVSDKHWIYFHEDEFIFHRISFPMNFSNRTVPEGKSSISTEISYSKYKEIEKHSVVERVIEDLIKAKILQPNDEILVTNVLDIKYGYVIYDHDHRKNVNIIHNFLKEHDIYPCGRFGEWEYFNMDHSILSGKKVADILNHNNLCC